VRILTVVLRVCEYVSGVFELSSEFCVFVFVWPHVYGEYGCSCIYGELVCVLLRMVEAWLCPVWGSTQEILVYLAFYGSST
jgi:hypothetical protein